MDFCPEVAVLQSAFQLLAKQAGSELEQLPKRSCDQFVPIITSVVDEICTGLEFDLEPDDSLLWQQKLHSLLLYGLVKKKYAKKEQVVVRGKVPVYDSLSLLTRVIPTYSCHFYLEVVKRCNWTPLLLESLTYLDTTIAIALLQDAVNHCKSEPRTETDFTFVAQITEEVLCQCLSIPGQSHTTIQSLLEPLVKPQCYIQTMFPDGAEELGAETDHCDDLELRNGIGATEVNTEVNCPQAQLELNVGRFWEKFLDRCPSTVEYITDHIEERLARASGHLGINEALSILAQEALLLYLVSLGRHDNKTDTWLLYNMWTCDPELRCQGGSRSKPSERDPEHGRQDGYRSKVNECRVDFVLASSMAKQCPVARLLTCIEKSLNVIAHSLKKSHSNKADKDIHRTVLNDRSELAVVSDLCINSKVIFRMLHGVLSRSGISDSGTGKLLEDCMSILDIMEDEKRSPERDMKLRDICQVVTGDSWEADVTLPAILWRLRYRLFYHEAVLERLLLPDSLALWTVDSVYDVLNENLPLLNHRTHVLGMVDILQRLYATCDTVDHIQGRLLHLICSAFTELPLAERDHVAMVVYTSARSAGDMLRNVTAGRPQMTNVFNKITADNSDKVFADVMLLCLTSPTDVMRTSVEMCVKNEEQAYNFAQLLSRVPALCGCYHDNKHPMVSLLCSTILEFLSTNHLSDKEEKHFRTFMSCLLQAKYGELNKPVLDSLEFLHEIVLPSVTVDNLRSTNYPIRCQFALNLLQTALESGCNRNSDWSEFQDDCVALVFNLAEILNDCVLIWVTEDVSGENHVIGPPIEAKPSVAMETGLLLLAVKEIALECYDKVCDMVLKGYLTGLDDPTVCWLIQESQELHWSVRQRFGSILTASGYHKWHTRYMDVFADLRKHLPGNLLTALQFVSVDSSCCTSASIDDSTEDMAKSGGKQDTAQSGDKQMVTYEDLITALVEILPNLLVTEATHVLMFVEGLIETGEVAVMYRPQSLSVLPLIDLSDMKRMLCISQILRDVIVTLTLIPGERSRLPMLHHVLQCYVTVVKARCDQMALSQDLEMFALSQIFHHVCDVCCHLPSATVDLSFVLLLHIATKVKDISSMNTSNVDDSVQTVTRKYTRNLESEMLAAVEEIPGEYEEKQMLVKKLSEEK